MSTIPWHTTPELIDEITGIAVEMVGAKLAFDWVLSVVKIAKRDPEVFDLMRLWRQAEGQRAKIEIAADLQDFLDRFDQVADTAA